MEGGNMSHLVSLKVMRLSRPTLSTGAWEPFYSSSPSFSAHSTSSMLSLQGKEPLAGNPKTLRDLSNVSQLLTLPASFGAIQLGETFSSCLCVNNEIQMDVEAISLKVEIQTVTSKVLLSEFGGNDFRLSAGDTLECVINHEIKELGQHVLACTVSYRRPAEYAAATFNTNNEETDDPSLLTFRKFYKFSVTNPLSVKTKVHASRSPSAICSLDERDKVFLEIHIQNLTSEPLWFERMHLECTDAWNAFDANFAKQKSIFSESMSLMQPQDMRQYIYILTPKIVDVSPVVHAPGSIIPLGRLDISWRSSFGEPGRLLTSMLSRRIPLPAPQSQNPASALPPHLKRNIVGPAPQPPRSQSRPTSPTGSRPISTPPYRTRTPSTSVSNIPKPQSPPPPPPPPLPPPDIDVHLVVRDIPRELIKIEQPFDVALTMVFSAPVNPMKAHLTRTLSVAVQHLQPPRLSISSPTISTTPSHLPTLMSATASEASTPGRSPTVNTFNYGLAHQKLLTTSPTQSTGAKREHERKTEAILPPPFADGGEASKLSRSPGAIFNGESTLYFSSIQLIPGPSVPTADVATTDDEPVSTQSRLYAFQDFTLSYIPLRKGFMPIGGLRVLLLDDKYIDDSDDQSQRQRTTSVPILKEQEIIAEVWALG